MARILLAEDDELMRITVRDRLRRHNWSVDAAANGQDALDLLDSRSYQLLITDVRMPGLDGIRLLEEVRRQSPGTDVIMMTAFGSIEDAVECLKKGASDYVLKPFDLDDLVIRIKRVLEIQQVKARCASLEDCCRQSRPTLIGESPPMREIYRLIEQAAPTDSTVLVTGESGTGKELVAAALHRGSLRADKPYIRINCAAIPDGLVESELFGHEKGAFTGAVSRKPGRFEMADGGTLLLDEIGDLALPLQAKLLRVLQEGEFERVGGTRTVRVDVRLICSTAKDLSREVEEGRFRQDLYFRLNVIPIVMPPLRERRGDILLLAEEFLKEFGIRRGENLDLSPEARDCLLRYDFPGNVRELKNIIERASVLARQPVIGLSDLPADICARTAVPEEEGPLALAEAMARTERRCILRALDRCKGNRTEAAAVLGISRKNLWQKMKAHAIEF